MTTESRSRAVDLNLNRTHQHQHQHQSDYHDYPDYGTLETGDIAEEEASASRHHRTVKSRKSTASFGMSSSSASEAAGIAEMEAVTRTWSRGGLYTAWGTIIMLSIAISLAMQTIFIYTNYATASFTQFSLLSALQVVQGVLYVVTRPIIAKIADVIGRFEGFLISTISMTVGTLMLAVSPNIDVYFVAQVFYIIGQVGLQFMQTIFAADTSNLANRALFTILPNVCFAFVPWTTAPITSLFLSKWSWRWGIAIWAIVLPCCALPLLSILFLNKLKSRKRLKRHFPLHHPYHHNSHRMTWGKLMEQLDVGGSSLLGVGLTMLFVAIPLASGDDHHWGEPGIMIMLVLGTVCLTIFPFYEMKYPRYPILTIRLLKNVEVAKSFLFITLYVVAFSIYSPYFFAWLMVVFDLSNTAATNVNVVTTVSSTVSGTISAFAIKRSRNIKSYIVAGVIIHTIGLSMIFYFRKVGSTTSQLVLAQAIDGIGAGLLTTPNQVFVQAFCSHREVAQVTGLYLSFFSLGQVVGDAVSGAVYRKYFAFYLKRYLPGKSKEWIDTMFDDYTKALEYPIGSIERNGIISAFNSVMRRLLLPPLIIYGVMFLISISFQNVKLDEIDDQVSGGVVFGSTGPSNSGDSRGPSLRRRRSSMGAASFMDPTFSGPAAADEQFFYDPLSRRSSRETMQDYDYDYDDMDDRTDSDDVEYELQEGNTTSSSSERQ